MSGIQKNILQNIIIIIIFYNVCVTAAMFIAFFLNLLDFYWRLYKCMV